MKFQVVAADHREEQYLVWSNEHNAWWHPKSAGYTKSHAAAGRYSRAEAVQICALARDGWDSRPIPSEIPVRAADVETAAAWFEKANKTASQGG